MACLTLRPRPTFLRTVYRPLPAHRILQPRCSARASTPPGPGKLPRHSWQGRITTVIVAAGGIAGLAELDLRAAYSLVDGFAPRCYHLETMGIRLQI
jgi:hypothetical protein